MQDEPTLAELKAWLGLEEGDTTDDVVLQESLDAALAAQASVVLYPADEATEAVPDPEPYFSADLRNAIMLRAQRLASRRNSPEGIVGITGAGGDFVGARVASYDADVTQLESPWRVLVVS